MLNAWHQLPPAVRAAVKGLALVLAYLAGAELGLSLSFTADNISPLWPSAGVAAVALQRWGARYWPAVFAGALLGSFASHDLAWAGAVKATGSTLEALAAVWIQRRLKVSSAFNRITDVLGLLAVVAAAPLVSTLSGPPVLLAAGQLAARDLGAAMALWWMGDAMGLLVVVPVLAIWTAPLPAGSPRTGAMELTAMLAVVLVITTLAFGPLAEWIAVELGRAPLVFIIFPPLLWAAIRGGPRAASLALTLTALVAVARSTAGHGPFGGQDMPHNLVMLELFLASTSVTVLMLAAAVCACHRLIADLARAKAEADAASQETARLMATVRHDLAHPLQAATLFLATMRSKPLPVAALPLLDRTAESLKAMEEMLADLKEVTTLQAGGEQVHLQPVPLALVLDQLAEEMRGQAEAKGLDFRYVRSMAIVRTDPVLLARIVRNLLVNAVRYTESGRVLLGCRHVPGRVRVEVRDTGPGIAPALQTLIFEAFQRGSAVGGGMGLGLSIVRRLAALMGHEVGLRSEEGRGACFWLTMPLD